MPASTTSPNRNSRHVRVLGTGDWRGFLAWNSGSGNLEPVFDALVHDPVSERNAVVCVKLYPGHDGRSRGLVNEITGWLIAHALKLPQPPHAYVLKVPLSKLKAPLPGWVRDLKRTTTTYWAFATAKMPAESAALRFSEADLPLLLDDLRRWPILPEAIALDEHIANTDRHLNNLLRLGKANYALIDNGRLAVEDGERNWQTAHLNSRQRFTNLLSEQCWGHSPTVATASPALEAGTRHPDALADVRQELEDWWRRLIADNDERAAFDRFVSTRATLLTTLLRERYRLI